MGSRDWHQHIITIDGMFGAGRHTLARTLAKKDRLIISQDAVLQLLAFRLPGEDVDNSARVSSAISALAVGDLQGVSHPQALQVPGLAVRALQLAKDEAIWPSLSTKFSELAKEKRGHVVLVGSAMGRTVCPEAGVRIFLSTRPEVCDVRLQGREVSAVQQMFTYLRAVPGDIRLRPLPGEERFIVGNSAELAKISPPREQLCIDTTLLRADTVLHMVYERFPQLSPGNKRAAGNGPPAPAAS